MQEHPLAVLDSAKDAEAMRALSEAVDELPHQKLIAVVSISGDKNIPEMIRHIASVADEFIITSHSVMGRAAERDLLGAEVSKYGLPWVSVEKVEDAVNSALIKAGKNDMILVAGSVFVVGEARRIWKGTDKLS
jgi:dihydrofolate synthase/folylpolyglutamate synthase